MTPMRVASPAAHPGHPAGDAAPGEHAGRDQHAAHREHAAAPSAGPRIRVTRDPSGIPWLHADDELALARLQGSVTARDRAWQIECERWRAEGRLAEHTGPDGVEWDAFARRIRLADTARRAYAALDDADRAWVDAYTAGIDEGLAAVRDEVPALVATGAPEPWPAWASLGVFLVAQVLTSSLPHLLWREHVHARLGSEAVDLLDTDGGPGAGSNAWALHGSRTRSGAPLLAGDPHRVMEIPGPYMQIRLVCPDYDVLGFAFPGVPGVTHLGHTGHAAWGITSAVAHDADVFREEIRPGPDGVEARGPGGWERAARRVERILVRGAAPVDVEVLETGRGPVVSGPDACGSAISVRTAARALDDLGFAALRPLLRARSVEDVARAFDAWVTPVDRVVAADAAGRVVRFTAGRVPERTRDERRLPLDAASAAGRAAAWLRGSLAVDVHDVHVDANERPADADADADLGYGYARGDRAARIRELLETARAGSADGRVDAADMDAVLGDTRSASAGELRRVLARCTGLSPAATRIRDRLDAWDLRFDADSGGAALFARWRAALVRSVARLPGPAALAAPHGHPALFDPWLDPLARIADALPVLLVHPDAPRVLGIDGVRVAAAALEDVAASGAADGDALWGDLHLLLPSTVLPPVDGQGASARGMPAPLDVRLGGDTDCVRSTSSVPGAGYRSTRASVARWVWDLGDRRRSRWSVPFGAAGDARDAHALDQLEDWAAARTRPVDGQGDPPPAVVATRGDRR
jgi:penicillin amidase